MDRMDCDRMFVAVLDTGSFSAAAARLQTSSGQASKLVSRLESLLGVQLLVRTTRALSPTEAGRAYYERVRPLLEEWDELDASIRSASSEAQGRVRLTVPLTFGTAILAPLFCEFAAAHPRIGLDVSFSDRAASLIDEGFDVAIRIGAPRDSSLVARRLCPVRIVTVASPAYLAAEGEPVAPRDLAGRECIVDTNFRDPHLWRFRDAAGGEILQTIRGRTAFGNAEACVLAAVAGLGVANGPSFVSGPHLRDGRLRRILTGFEPEPVVLSALYPSKRHLPAKVRVLVDFLVARFREDPAWDRGWQS